MCRWTKIAQMLSDQRENTISYTLGNPENCSIYQKLGYCLWFQWQSSQMTSDNHKIPYTQGTRHPRKLFNISERLSVVTMAVFPFVDPLKW